MIQLFFGENSYAREAALADVVGTREAEVYEAEKLNAAQLVDIFQGSTLFATERTVVIRGAAQASWWGELVPRLEQADADSTYLLVDDTVDKRTSTYKWLVKYAKVQEFTHASPRDANRLRTWLREQATAHDLTLPSAIADDMIERATRPSDRDGKPIIDQQQLATVVQQLAGSGEVTSEMIESVMPASTSANVFGLLELALDRRTDEVQVTIDRLRQHEDGYKVLGLLASQVVSLGVLAMAGDRSVDEVAHDTGLSPYSLRGMARTAHQLDRAQAASIIAAMARADERVKRGQEPWQEIETALLKMIHRN